jgi:hypothetical protein
MISAKVYRQRAQECAQLANEATEVYVKAALSELATEFQKLADATEREQSTVSIASPQKRAANRRAA